MMGTGAASSPRIFQDGTSGEEALCSAQPFMYRFEDLPSPCPCRFRLTCVPARMPPLTLARFTILVSSELGTLLPTTPSPDSRRKSSHFPIFHLVPEGPARYLFP